MSHFFLDKKVAKSQENLMLLPFNALAGTLNFHPALQDVQDFHSQVFRFFRMPVILNTGTCSQLAHFLRLPRPTWLCIQSLQCQIGT